MSLPLHPTPNDLPYQPSPCSKFQTYSIQKHHAANLHILQTILLLVIFKEFLWISKGYKQLVSIVHPALAFHISIFSKTTKSMEPHLAQMCVGRSSITVVFFVQIRYSRWPPGPIMCFELLPSLGVNCPLLDFHFSIFSETTKPNRTKLGMNVYWKVLCKNCVFHSDRKFNMAATANNVF